MSGEEIAKAFIAHYYQAFQSGPASLAPLYSDASMLTFEGNPFQGRTAIVDKYTKVGSLAFDCNTMDVQPCPSPNAMCIFVTGKVKIDGGNPLHYTQFFQLVAQGPGQYYVHNDIFRLVYA